MVRRWRYWLIDVVRCCCPLRWSSIQRHVRRTFASRPKSCRPVLRPPPLSARPVWSRPLKAEVAVVVGRQLRRCTWPGGRAAGWRSAGGTKTACTTSSTVTVTPRSRPEAACSRDCSRRNCRCPRRLWWESTDVRYRSALGRVAKVKPSDPRRRRRSRSDAAESVTSSFRRRRSLTEPQRRSDRSRRRSSGLLGWCWTPWWTPRRSRPRPERLNDRRRHRLCRRCRTTRKQRYWWLNDFCSCPDPIHTRMQSNHGNVCKLLKQREEASTHESANTHAGKFFYDSWPWPLIPLFSFTSLLFLFLSASSMNKDEYKINGFPGLMVFLHQVWRSWLHRFLRYRAEKKHRQTAVKTYPRDYR